MMTRMIVRIRMKFNHFGLDQGVHETFGKIEHHKSSKLSATYFVLTFNLIARNTKSAAVIELLQSDPICSHLIKVFLLQFWDSTALFRPVKGH